MNDEITIQSHKLITPDHLRRFALCYIRQSTEEQVRNNTASTELQRALADVARSYGWPDSQIQIIDEDLGKSGASSERRTGWQKMLTMIAAKQVGVVFVASISRLSRKLHDFEIIRMLSADQNTLIYSDGRLADPADSSDIFMSQITASVAQFENQKRTELFTRARISKAKQGAVVSLMPVGWIKGPDGKYDFDLETKDAIRIIFETFFQTRSAHKTVRALLKAGVQTPSRVGQRVYFRDATLSRVVQILRNPNYAGTYVYGLTQSQPGGVAMADGRVKRINVAPERWIRTYNHHPGYITEEQHQEIDTILRNNRFQRRDRPGRGPALFQGLLRCVNCNNFLQVNYRKDGRSFYRCHWVMERCTQFSSRDLDGFILGEFFKVLATPPLEMLKAALEETRSQERKRLFWIKSERERLDHQERKARERVELTQGHLPRVYFDAMEKLENVFVEKERFEQKIAMTPMVPKSDATEKELEEISRLTSNVPKFWHHEKVTNLERKEILRFIVNHVVIGVTSEQYNATIIWKSGRQTSLPPLWRGMSRYNLIRELHAQKLTTIEIQKRLLTGQTSTGQVFKLSLIRLYDLLKNLGLKPKRFADRDLLQQEASVFNQESRPLQWIAQNFNERGFVNSTGTAWTTESVRHLLTKRGEKPESMAILHRRVITEAHARRLSYQQIAREFNDKNIRRRGHPIWTADDVASRARDLQLGTLKVRLGMTSESMAILHRRVFTEAHAQGLSYREMAREFNHKNIPKRGDPLWTRQNVTWRAKTLDLTMRKVRKESLSTEMMQPVALPSST